MSCSIGIDLGDNNTVVAFTLNGSNPRVLKNRERLEQTPSVVARHRDGKLLIGSTAQRVGKTDPQNVIFSIRRLIGRRYQDAEVAVVQKHVSYRIVASQDGNGAMANVMIGDKQYSPIEVSALILRKIKEDAEEALGQSVTHAVITVPAYFDDNQREATRQAGALAGLKVKRIVDEPTAAAYAFGMDLNMSDAKAVVVYDMGGSSFDISVIFIGSGIPTVEAIGGDIWLGGDRFDNAIIDFVLSQYPGQRDALCKDAASMLELKGQAEYAKMDISGGAPSADVVILGVLRGKLDVEVTIRAEQFEGMIREDIEGSLKAVDDTLAEANMSVADIDHVLLVGGSTGLPLIRRLLIAKFGAEKVKATVKPLECVALGAAILASLSEKKFCPKRKCSHENEPDAARCSGCGADLLYVETQVKCPHCGELHAKHEVICPVVSKPLVGAAGGVTARPIGIGFEDGRFEIVVPKATRYPTSAPIWRRFRIPTGSAGPVIVPIYQGFEPVASRNEFQGRIVVELPTGACAFEGGTLDIGFGIDEHGLLTVSVRGTGSLAGVSCVQIVRPWENSAEAPWGKTKQSNLSADNPARLRLMAACLLNTGRAADFENLLAGPRRLEEPSLHFYSALAYARQEKVDQAARIFSQILEREPENKTVRRAAITLLHRHAVRLINRRHAVPAAQALDDALKLDPRNAELLDLMSKIENLVPIERLQSNKRQEAVEAWEKAQRRDPENGRVTHSLALACFFWAASEEAQGRGYRAEPAWRKAIVNWVMACYNDTFWAKWSLERSAVYALPAGAVAKLRNTWGEQLGRRLRDAVASYMSGPTKDEKSAQRCRALELTLWLEDTTACALAELKKAECPACGQNVAAAVGVDGPPVCDECGGPLPDYPAHPVLAAGPLGLKQFGAEAAARLVTKLRLPNASVRSGGLEKLGLSFIKTNTDALKFCLSPSAAAFALVGNRRFEEALASLDAAPETGIPQGTKKPDEPSIHPQDLIDLATVGASLIIEGATEYKEWTRRVMADFGDVVETIAGQTGQTPEDLLREVHKYSATGAKKYGVTAETPTAVNGLNLRGMNESKSQTMSRFDGKGILTLYASLEQGNQLVSSGPELPSGPIPAAIDSYMAPRKQALRLWKRAAQFANEDEALGEELATRVESVCIATANELKEKSRPFVRSKQWSAEIKMLSAAIEMLKMAQDIARRDRIVDTLAALLLERGLSHLETGDTIAHHTSAIADFEAARKLNPDHEDAKRRAAHAYNTRGCNQANRDSIADFTQAIRLYPQGLFYANRAWAYLAADKFDSALTDLASACKMERNPDYLERTAQVHNAKGVYILDRYLGGRPSRLELIEAQSCFQQALLLDPANSTFQENHRLVSRRLGQR